MADEDTITIEEAREKIAAQVDYIDIKPYSHNIISIVLTRVSNVHSKEEANKLIDEFSLEDYGWHKR